MLISYQVNGAGDHVLRSLLGSLVLYYPIDQYKYVLLFSFTKINVFTLAMYTCKILCIDKLLIHINIISSCIYEEFTPKIYYCVLPLPTIQLHSLLNFLWPWCITCMKLPKLGVGSVRLLNRISDTDY